MDAQVTHAKQPIQPPRWVGRVRKLRLLSATTLLIPAFTLAQGTSPTAVKLGHIIVRPDQLVWKALIPGVEVAVVSGDPDKKGGVYVIRIRAKAEAKVPPHWHVTDEHITVLEGSFWLAHGEQFDAPKLQELRVGAHAMMPAGMRHFGLHKPGNVIEVFGEGPFVINYVNPEDDPNRGRIK